MPFDALSAPDVSTTDEVVQCLLDGYARLSVSPRHWCKYRLSRQRYDKGQKAFHAHCAIGALRDDLSRRGRKWLHEIKALHFLNLAAVHSAQPGEPCWFTSIMSLNDHHSTTYEKVLAVYRKAIELAVADAMARSTGKCPF